MTDAPIRVWLEPGFDGGRIGCWMLDWPGCFCWGATRETALARGPSAVQAHLCWLAEHGEPVPEPPIQPEVTIAEEVAAVRAGDGAERNATFQREIRPVGPDLLSVLLRRLEWARFDLLGVVRRIRDFESRGGSLPGGERESGGARGSREARSVDDVLRHVAEAEPWYVSRIDPTAYPGPFADAGVDGFLAGTRAWALRRLTESQARDPLSSATDENGETWTLAKVLRRFLYHSLDHLDELDRRLAGVERRVERLEVRGNAPIDLDELARLLRLAGLGGRTRDRDRLARMVAGSTETVSAWDEGRLVGFARAISDGAFNAYVSTVAVHPRWQDRGLGHRLMRALVDARDDLRFVLRAREGTEGFYRSVGFEFDPLAMARDRRR